MFQLYIETFTSLVLYNFKILEMESKLFSLEVPSAHRTNILTIQARTLTMELELTLATYLNKNIV